MKRKWFIMIAMGLMIGILSGCNQVEDILGKVNQLLDQQLAEDNEGGEDVAENVETVAMEEDVESTNEEEAATTTESESSSDTTEEGELAAEETATATKIEPEVPFDEQLLAQGYDNMVLPNGFPLALPYHWIMVEDHASGNGFDGSFCFDIPQEINQIAEGITGFAYAEHEHHGEGNDTIHTTTFTLGPEFGGGEGTISYYVDGYDNTCANITILYGGDEVEEFYGEDPATMVSEEELAMMQEGMDLEELGVSEDRVRSLPDDYDAFLNVFERSTQIAYIDYDAEDITSIRDRIMNNEVAMMHLLKGYPEIFPYEWYLVEENDDPANASWSGKFCTDTQLGATIAKHHDMLGQHNADISTFTFDENSDEKSSVEFAFNDAYGTGSWHGHTTFLIDRTDSPEVHKCADVSMAFSAELLP